MFVESNNVVNEHNGFNHFNVVGGDDKDVANSKLGQIVGLKWLSWV